MQLGTTFLLIKGQVSLNLCYLGFWDLGPSAGFVQICRLNYWFQPWKAKKQSIWKIKIFATKIRRLKVRHHPCASFAIYESSRALRESFCAWGGAEERRICPHKTTHILFGTWVGRPIGAIATVREPIGRSKENQVWAKENAYMIHF